MEMDGVPMGSTPLRRGEHVWMLSEREDIVMDVDGLDGFAQKQIPVLRQELCR
jgi:hypothetical protein